MLDAIPGSGGCLCLDLASSTTGWAYGPLDVQDPSLFGTWHMPKLGTEGMKYACFANALYETIGTCRPASILVEAMLPPMAQTDAKTAFRLYGVRAITHEAAFRESIPVSEISADAARLDVLGRCRWPNRDQTKPAIVRFCRDHLKLVVSDHNAADALVLLTWARRRARGLPPATGPLFAEARGMW